MKKLIIILFIFMMNSSILVAQNTISKEQIAFEYFFEKIFPLSYKEKICKFQFDGLTEKELSNFGTTYDFCLGKEIALDLYKNLNSNTNLSPGVIDLNKLKNVNIIFKKGSQKYRIYILKASKINNLHYVQIEITKKKHYTDAYFLVINEQNVVINWCKTGNIM